jgi:putative two-component system response regulator
MDGTRKRIMLVDDNISNLQIGKNALIDQYDVYTAPSAEKMFNLLKLNLPDLILLDIDMPGMDGHEAIKALKQDARLKEIPVIFLTSITDSGSELEGLTLGAIDYISKPFSPPLLRKRIEVHLLVESQKHDLQEFNHNLQELVEAKTRKVVKLQDAILKTVADLVECRDNDTGGHIERTQHCLEVLLNGMLRHGLYGDQFGGEDIALLLQSSQLHDVGKISIPDSILKKPGKLTPEEFAEMKEHANYGIQILEKIEALAEESDFLRHAKVFAGTHHEKWDGSGYPRGLAGEDIPLLGRLMAIADVYDALTSERPYKKAFPHEEAVRIIVEGKGTHFDPAMIEIFIQVSDLIRNPVNAFSDRLRP